MMQQWEYTNSTNVKSKRDLASQCHTNSGKAQEYISVNTKLSDGTHNSAHKVIIPRNATEFTMFEELQVL